MNRDHRMSAQPCGCDEGANHTCERHTLERMERLLTAEEQRDMHNEQRAAALDKTEAQRRNAVRESIRNTTLADLIFLQQEVSVERSLRTAKGAARLSPVVEPKVSQHLPTNPADRKGAPIYSGVVRYFPDALVAVAQLSKVGNDQHNPGQPLHWAREKSTDHGDCILRHQVDVGTIDTDGVRHATKVAWRALAQLQLELEAARKSLQEEGDR